MTFETATDASKWSSSVIAYIIHYICKLHTVKPTRCNLVIEFIIPMFIEGSTCYERHTAHHQVCRSLHGEPSINVGIINYITRLHLVGYFCGFVLRCADP